MKGLVWSSWFQRVGIHGQHGRGTAASGQAGIVSKRAGTENSHLETQVGSRKSRLEQCEAFETLKPAPSDTLPKSSSTVLPTKDQVKRSNI